MIKGVTKNIIELNNMNSKYFEKAIVIIKDSCSLDYDELSREAEKTIGNQPPAFIKKQKAAVRLKMLICGVTGAFLAALMCGVIYLFV